MRDEELNDLVSEYIAEAQKRGVKVEDDLAVVKYSDKETGKLDGVCLMAGKFEVKLKRIYINTRLKNNKDRLKAIVFHESAHCLSNAKHSKVKEDLMFFEGVDRIEKSALDSFFSNL